MPDETKRNTRKIIAVTVLSIAFIGCTAAGVVAVLFLSSSNDEGNVYSSAAVAADNGQCSQVGRDVLQDGGSAVDAAISSMLCIGVVHCDSAGIGGGFFMTVYSKESGEKLVIDARETAPSQANQTMFVDQPEKSRAGGLSVAIPGELHGYWEAHGRFGKLPWKQLFQPAITIAREGFTIGASLAKSVRDSEEYVREDPGLSDLFLNEDGSLKGEGDRCVNGLLADTLESIAAEGPDDFYTGDIASYTVQEVTQEQGGILTLDDLANYTVAIKQPLQIDFMGHTVLTAPPPSSGAVVLMLLNIMDAFDLTEEDMMDTDGAVLTYHRFAEACKFSFAKRADLGDVDFVDGIDSLLDLMTSEDFADDVRREINDTWITYENSTLYASYVGSQYYNRHDHGTSHLSVLAENGDAVSVTSTINNSFGAKFRSLRTGLIINNQMDSFSSPGVVNSDGIRPSEANFISPGKRPMSSMSPTLILDKNGNVVMVIGASGSSRMVTSISLVTMETLVMNNGLQDAVKKPRIHHKWLPNYVEFEQTFRQDYVTGLQKFGHQLESSSLFGVVQAIQSYSGKVFAESDARKGGFPAGY
ncbi:glutathione hydrolase 1 proenzyme-like [Ptychodera flava]|uniref:glutathione hydrolase 1 proenzyme-like n=1 Tax=Ptychodera flava TaxID=63121 RepID=UPI00396A8AF8